MKTLLALLGALVLAVAVLKLLVLAQGTGWAPAVAALVCLPLLAVTFKKAPL